MKSKLNREQSKMMINKELDVIVEDVDSENDILRDLSIDEENQDFSLKLGSQFKINLKDSKIIVAED